MAKQQPPLHPGDELREEFMEPHNLSAGKLATARLTPRTRIARIAREEARLSGDTAVRLAKLFGTSVEFWLNHQIQFDSETAKHTAAKDLAAIKPLDRGAACHLPQSNKRSSTRAHRPVHTAADLRCPLATPQTTTSPGP